MDFYHHYVVLSVVVHILACFSCNPVSPHMKYLAAVVSVAASVGVVTFVLIYIVVCATD